MTKTKTKKIRKPSKLQELQGAYESIRVRLQNQDSFIKTLQARLNTVEGERNALRQTARFARLSQMDVQTLNHRMQSIEQLLQVCHRMMAEFREPSSTITVNGGGMEKPQ